MTDLPPGQVTTADLYRVLVTLSDKVSQALTRLEVITNRNEVADQTHRDHEKRIRALEAAKAKLIGAAMAASAIAGALGAWAGIVIGRH